MGSLSWTGPLDLIGGSGCNRRRRENAEDETEFGLGALAQRTKNLLGPSRAACGGLINVKKIARVDILNFRKSKRRIHVYSKTR